MNDSISIHGVVRIEIEPGRDMGGADARSIHIVCADGSERRITAFAKRGPVPVIINSDAPDDPRADEANERGIIDAQTLEESDA